MNCSQFSREKEFGAGIAIARRLLKHGLITKAEYRRVRAALIKKYRPVVDCLMDLHSGDIPRVG